MLKKENRLSSDFEFKITKKYGQKQQSDFMYFYVLSPRNYEGSCKIGIVVSNRFHKNAVVRNRTKRLISEAIRDKLNDLPDNIWIVIYPNKKILEAEYEKICSDVDQVLQKISVA